MEVRKGTGDEISIFAEQINNDALSKDWNKLPNEIKEQKTVNAFKSRLDAWLKTNNYK